ncbi:RNA polymerase sigma factor [Candidatus Daviesbacteria bacterium]|nr:RNA polymerase sigma factor [Candidatus Daviesbacteria bacterium]
MENINVLIQRAQKGNKDAFGEIYKIYFKKIYRYCRINLEREETAKDLAQETFLKAWRALPTFSTGNGGSIQAFLFRIARNLIIDLSRKKIDLPLDTALEVEAREDIEEQLDRKNDITLVQKALSKLQEEDKQIVILRFFEEMPTAQIAQVVGLSEGNLRVRLHRVLKKLKGMIYEK